MSRKPSISPQVLRTPGCKAGALIRRGLLETKSAEHTTQDRAAKEDADLVLVKADCCLSGLPLIASARLSPLDMSAFKIFSSTCREGSLMMCACSTFSKALSMESKRNFKNETAYRQQ